MSERQACRITRISPTVVRYRKRPDRNSAVRKRLCELAAEHPRLGAPMLYDMLRNEGFLINHKRLERLYRLEKLSLRRKRRRKFSAVRLVAPRATRPMERLAIDFMSDSTVRGRKVRVLTVVDEFSRICSLLEVAYSMTGRDVVKALEKISAAYGVPKAV